MTIRTQIQSSLAQTRSTAASLQQPMAKGRKKSKSRPKSSTVAIYAGVFVLLVVLVALGFRTPNGGATVASVAQDTSSTSDTISTTTASDTSVDTVTAAQIAANVAEGTNMTVTPYVAGDAVSVASSDQISQTTTSTTINKPSLVDPSKSIDYTTKNYVVQAGDTASSIAAKFGLQPNTVKWANDLSSDYVAAGTTLTILPTDGVYYTVKTGDTLTSVASKYKSDATRITLYNDLTSSTLTPNTKIILPGGVLPTTEQPGYVTPYAYNTAAYGYVSGNGRIVGAAGYISGATHNGNVNYYGECTWYAWERRYAMGIPLPGGVIGDAWKWGASAGDGGVLARDGYTINHTPSVGAIAQWGHYEGGSGWYGHVAVVEAVNSDGTVTISEMNNGSLGGWGVVDTRTIPANSVSNYIH